MPVTIPLTRGLIALVDECDAELVASRKWYPSIRRNGLVYAISRGGLDEPETVYMHRLVMGRPHAWIDHVDHDGLNNRRSNLRPATHAQNVFYRRNERAAKRNKNGFAGVAFVKTSSAGGIFYGRITVGGKQLYTSGFSTAIEAARAWDGLAIQHYGEFASLNFPPQASA